MTDGVSQNLVGLAVGLVGLGLAVKTFEYLTEEERQKQQSHSTSSIGSGGLFGNAPKAPTRLSSAI